MVAALGRLRPRDVAVLLVAFLVGTRAGLAVAVAGTMALAALLLIKRTLEAHGHLPEVAEDAAGTWNSAMARGDVPEGVTVFHVRSVRFLGRGGPVARALSLQGDSPSVLIVAVHDPSPIDPTGLEGLLALRDECRRRKIRLIVSGVRMVRERESGGTSGIEWAAGPDDALERARAGGTAPGGG